MTAPQAGPYIARRPRRADGARNYDAILAAAHEEFTAHGLGASLEEIAQRSGVAIGTLYRHFPTRECLVEAATREGLGALVAHAEREADALPPLVALTSWMREAIRHFGTYRGLAEILGRSMYDVGTPSHEMCERSHAAGARLLTAAQAAGDIRADLTTAELFDLLMAAAWIRETSGEAGLRVLDVVIDGMTAPSGRCP